MYTLKAKQIPFHCGYDVIVIGGGPAGCAAAIASAREGAKTLLIEATGILGGMGTNGLVPFWCGFSNGGDLCSTGIGKRVMEQLQAEMPHVGSGTKGGAIDAEALKRVYDELVTDSGAQVLFHTMLSDVDVDEKGTVNAVIVSNKAGLSAYKAKTYVDCTGDADLVAWAGGDFELGDELGEMQPATMCFTLTNVDMDAFSHIKNHRVIHTEDGKYPLIPDDHCCFSVVGPNAVGFNAGHVYNVNGTDPINVSAALIRARKMVGQIKALFAEKFPEAYGKAYLAATSSLLGVREGRRIKGDYKLLPEDYYARRVFPDEIARNCYNFDSHETPTEIKLMAERKLAHHPEEVVYKPGESHGIPYRCLTPVKLRNVIVAGRSICAERRVMGSIRIMATCLSLGEAAGIAAALLKNEEEPDFHHADVSVLRHKLLEHGAFIL
ncbi:MAG: FAD-dependent oxidoreductase [Clostridiaceae bacterium]|nr:FAD-dependent oxidoreductase [Clostridiaceae bacterium]